MAFEALLELAGFPGAKFPDTCPRCCGQRPCRPPGPPLGSRMRPRPFVHRPQRSTASGTAAASFERIRPARRRPSSRAPPHARSRHPGLHLKFWGTSHPEVGQRDRQRWYQRGCRLRSPSLALALSPAVAEPVAVASATTPPARAEYVPPARRPLTHLTSVAGCDSRAGSARRPRAEIVLLR